MAKAKKSDAEIAKAIQSLHSQTMKEIEQQIEAFYGRYATTEGITMAEAKKRVSKLDIDEYAKKAKRYVKGAHSGNEFIAAQSFTDAANAEMAIYNLTMKVNRLELLKANIALDLAAMTSDEEHHALEKLTESAREEFARQSGILGMTIEQNEKSVSSIVNASFHNATWSERLWANQAALKADLETLLTRGMIQGKNPKVLARDLRKSFDASIADSERLMITEMARIQEEVFRESMEQAGIDEYEYIAESGACRICAPLDGKIFKVKNGMPGSNKAPMHPRCRCSSAAHYDRAAWEKRMKEREKAKTSDFNIKTAEEARKLLVEKGGFLEVEDSFLKVNEKLQISNIQQLLKLEEKFGAVHESRSVTIVGNARNASTRAYVNTFTVSPLQQNLSLSPQHFNDRAQLIESTRDAITENWSMPAKMTDEVLEVYTVTHEYGHLLQNMLTGKLMQERGWTPEKPMNMFDAKKKTKKAQMKFYTKARNDAKKEHMKEIVDVAKESDSDFSLFDHISDYGKTNEAEFFAEVFANSQLGKPNALGDAMNIWLKRKGIIKNDD